MWVKKFAEITLSHMVFEIQAFFCFAILRKIRIFKMASHLAREKFHKRPPFWKDKIFFLKTGSATQQSYPQVKNFVEIALSSTVFEIQAFLVSHF